MKAPLKQRTAAPRPDPAEVLRLAAEAAPQQPPALVTQPPVTEKSTTMNLRVMPGTILGVEATAKAKGLTMKQVVIQALQAAGVEVAAADLEDRTPRRKK